MKVFISTFGCKVNQYESQVILEKFINKGFEQTNNLSLANIVVVNSCTVTKESSSKALKFINKIRKVNKHTIIALVGCLPQAFPDEISNNPEISVILGNKNKFEIVDEINKYLSLGEKIIKIEPYTGSENFRLSAVHKFEGKTRAFIKIQDGCNQFCSYCIIPYVRGRSCSKKLEDIISEAKSISLAGYKEIVLVGINLATYGMDLIPKENICSTVKHLSKITGIKRIRLGSLEPQFMNEKILKELAHYEKVCPQFHLSLQSGCDATLKRMNRHYSTLDYSKVVENIHKYFNNASVTTDVMVGFPGETNEEFKESLNFVEKMEFFKVHVFPFSVRKGTRAEKLPNKISKEIKNYRCKEMLNLVQNLKEKFLQKQVGKTVSVLFEKITENGENKGHAPNYVLVYTKNNSNLEGKILDVRIEISNKESCRGSVC